MGEPDIIEGATRWWSCGPIVNTLDNEQREVRKEEEVIPGLKVKKPPDDEATPFGLERKSHGGPAASASAAPGNTEVHPRSAGATATTAPREDTPVLTSEEARALEMLPDAIRRSPLAATLEPNCRLYSDPINPFSDTPRGGSPNSSPMRSSRYATAASLVQDRFHIARDIPVSS